MSKCGGKDAARLPLCPSIEGIGRKNPVEAQPSSCAEEVVSNWAFSACAFVLEFSSRVLARNSAPIGELIPVVEV
jgi:hypothetical protein